MNTFTDKIEAVFAEMKGEMIRLFGDHTSIHDAAQDARGKVMQAAGEHFPPSVCEDENPVSEDGEPVKEREPKSDAV